MVDFSKVDRWCEKKRGVSFWEKHAEFFSDADRLLDVFCNGNEQRRRLEKDKLQMTHEDYIFYEDQKCQRIEK